MKTPVRTPPAYWSKLLEVRDDYEMAYKLAYESNDVELAAFALNELIELEGQLLEFYFEEIKSRRPEQTDLLQKYTTHLYSVQLQSATIAARLFLTDSTQSQVFDPSPGLQLYKKATTDVDVQTKELAPQIRAFADTIILTYLKKGDLWKALQTLEESRSFSSNLSISWSKRDILLPEDICLVPIIVTPDQTIAWILSGKGLERQVSLDITTKDTHVLATKWTDAWCSASLEERHSSLDNLLQKLSEFLHPLVSVLGELEGKKLLFLAPNDLQFFPLHAIEANDMLLGDRFRVGYTPSLHFALSRQTLERPQSTLIVSNPTGDLPYTHSEALAVKELLGTDHILWESQATRNALIQNISKVGIVHFAGHSLYNWTDPKKSGLVLWDEQDDNLFTLHDIRELLKCAPSCLVVLSCCETALTDPADSLGEYACLAGEFLRVGATAVIASLWAVDDLATALLMRRFYQVWDRGAVSIAAALHEAQRWLRTRSRAQVDAALTELDKLWEDHSDDPTMEGRAVEQYWDIRQARQRLEGMEDPPFAHPYWWAAFQAVGDVL